MGAGAGGTSADAILDVITARMGLSQYFAALDALTDSPAFQAAAADGPHLLTPVTWDEAMAADEGTPLPRSSLEPLTQIPLPDMVSKSPVLQYGPKPQGTGLWRGAP